jgi:alpha-mannosidase
VQDSLYQTMSQKIPVVHMIGQAHLDPVWLWPWTEGRAEALATCCAAVNYLNEYPEFHYTRGEAHIYRWVEAEAPELWTEIRRLVAEGRWHVVNGMVIQPDMNLPQGESFARQALLGKRYFREKLGLDVRIAYCVDSFGHAGTLPQILSKCGFDYYVFMRPEPLEKDLPSQVFWWQSPDGSRILTYRIPGPYQTGRLTDYESHLAQALAGMPDELAETMSFFGIGNHGGGPTREQIEHIHTLAQRREDIDIRFSHPQAYFDAVAPQAANLPIVQDELQYHAVGCYTVNSQLKRLHREAEGALLTAERLACLAELWADKATPTAELDRLWWDLLFNQFHDTLGGSSIKRGGDEAIMALGRVILSARELMDDASRAIAARIDTRGPGSSVVVFNPFPHRLQQYIEYEPWIEWGSWEADAWGLVDEAGEPVSHQLVEADAAVNAPNTAINRLVFPVDLPPLGYRLYRFAHGLPRRQLTSRLIVTPETLENEHWRLRVDPTSGAITSCLDRATGVELVGPMGWNLAQVLHDDSDTWSHGVAGYDQVIGRFEATGTKVCDQGPLQASLLIERVYEGGTWLQQVILRQSDPAILLRNWLTWQSKWCLLKLAFQVPTDQPRSFHDVPFGWLERPCNGEEVPTQMWLDVTGPLVQTNETGSPVEQGGLVLLNDGKYGCDVRGNLMRLTILRTPPYAYHEPHVFGTKCRYDWVDQGFQEFNLILLPHLGDWRETDLIARARALNMPPVLTTTHAHAGEHPPVGSPGKLVARELELTALKPAEDGAGFVVRIADKHGRGGGGRLIWGEGSFDITLAPFEVATWRLYQEGGRWHFVPCDMLERPLAGL